MIIFIICDIRFRTPAKSVFGRGCLDFSLSLYGNETGFLTINQYTFNPTFRVFTKRTIYKEGGYSVREIEDTSSFWNYRFLPVDFVTGQDVYVGDVYSYGKS